MNHLLGNTFQLFRYSSFDSILKITTNRTIFSAINKNLEVVDPSRLSTIRSIKSSHYTNHRACIHLSSFKMTKALVLGTYQTKKSNDKDESDDNVKNQFTEAAENFDKQVDGKLKSLVSQFGPSKKGKAKVFYGLSSEFPVVAVVGLGSPDAGYNDVEEVDEKRENIRSSIASGARLVRDEQNVDQIIYDPCSDSEAAAEGANLSLWHFDELKSAKYKKKPVKIDVFNPSSNSEINTLTERGRTLAEAQNICRRLANLPSNHLTPTIFSETIQNMFKDLPNVEVKVHDKKWAEDKKMGSFLSVAKGSVEPPKFIEIHYNNKPSSTPVALVGKGICFDSGGISIKPAAAMDKMRYDMSGAANVISATYALAKLKAQVNIITLAPLCENMPSGSAYKPGDVIYAMNGKSIQVDNTDAEGRLILADALCYAHEFKPQLILDCATLTGAVSIALGSSAAAAYTTSNDLYQELRRAASRTGDRVWRMPLFNHYKRQVTDSQLADCLNTSKQPRMGGSCTAAAFLSEFVTCDNWIHLDIAGVMELKDDHPYCGRGMSGRPMRTICQYVINRFNPSN